MPHCAAPPETHPRDSLEILEPDKTTLAGTRGLSTDIFISYRRTDRRSAELLAKSLGEHGVSAWYDGMIAPGADWRADIIENIKMARVLVILFSHAANDSQELAKELSAADQSQTLIVPVRIQNVVPTGAYQYELAVRNWFDAFENPAGQLDHFAREMADALKTPGELRRRLAKSAATLDERRWRRLHGERGLLRNSTFLTLILFVSSIVQFFVYDSSVDAVARLAEGQTPRILAYALIAFVVSAGSPLLLIQAVGQQLTGSGWLILPCSLLNAATMVLMVRNALAWISFRRSRHEP